MPLLERSAPDSARFGLEVYRGKLATLDVGALISFITEVRPELVIVRVPGAEIEHVHALSQLGVPTCVADLLVYYAVDLAGRTHALAAGVRLGTPADAPALSALASAVFADYFSHYRSNPDLPRADLGAGYAEWAVSYLGAEALGRCCWLAEAEGQLVGFLTATRLPDGRGEVVLNGVATSHRNRGLYTQLLRAAEQWFLAHGCTQAIVSTQAHNVAVQRVWQSAGWRLIETWLTLHLNVWKAT